MTNIPFHEHTFVIPTASTEEIAAGIVSDKAVTPDQLLPVLESLEFSEAMPKLIYDPNNVAADVFDMDNMVEGATNLILTAAERALIASAVQAGDALVSADIGTTVQAWDAQLDSLSSASANGVSLVTAADYAAMRTLLGLGTAATQNTGTSGGNVPLLNGVNTWSGVQSYQSAVWQGGISATAQGTNTSGFASSTAGGSIVLENTSASGSGGGGGFIAYSNDGAAMASGDRLGLNLFGGSSSASAIRNTAGIAAYSSQAWVDGSAYGTRLEFQTTANSGTTRATKLILGNGGILTFGATEASSVPALKPSSAVLQARLGDDSDYAVMSIKSLTVSDAATTRTNLGVAIGSNVQAWDADLDALAALAATAGMLSRTGAGAFAVRTLTAPAAGITVSNGTGASGNPTLALANDLSALEGLSTTGLARRTATDTWDTVAYREVLTANRIYYVRSDGSNSNTGLANTSGGAFLTIQKAWDTIVTIDLNGFTATIKLGNTATFTTGLNATVSPVGGNVIIEGDTSTPANTLVSVTSADAIALNCVANLTVQYCELRTTTSGNSIVSGAAGAKVTIGAGMRFGACAGYQLYALNAGNISGSSNYTISGAAACHSLATLAGTIILSSLTVTVSGTPAFSSAFAVASLLGAISAYSITYSGSATGQRYNSSLNAAIQTYGGGASYFPGNSAGATATGGQYA